MEHGKKFCKHAPSVPEVQIKTAICERLGMDTWNETGVKEPINVILVHSYGRLQIELKSMEYLELLPN